MHISRTAASRLAGAALAVAAVAFTGLAASAATTPASAPVAPKPAAVTPAKPAAPAKAGPSDKAQIEALEKGFVAAFKAKNVDRIMSYYAKDGLFVFDVVPPREYDGWAAYQKDFTALFGAFSGPLDMTLSELSITVVGSVAYGHSIQDSHFTGADGSKNELVARVTDVYRKIGGHWKIVQEHVSVPIDLATGKPDMLSKP